MTAKSTLSIDYLTLFDRAPEAMAVLEVASTDTPTDQQYRYVAVNEALLRSYRLARGAVVSKTPHQLFPQKQADTLCQFFQDSFEAGSPAETQMVLDTGSGSRLWQVKASCVGTPRQDASLLMIITRDMTQTSDFRDKLDAVADFLPGVVYQLQSDSGGDNWRVIYAGPNISRMLGISIDEVLADSDALLRMIHPEDFPMVLESSLEAARTHAVWTMEYRLVTSSGEIRWISCHDLPTHLEDGSILYTGYAEDITARKLLQDALMQSEQRYRSLVETATDIIGTVSVDGTISYMSSTLESALGYPPDTVIGKNVSEFVHPQDLPYCLEALQRIYTSGLPADSIEYRVRHMNGTWVNHLSNGAPVKDDNGNVLTVMLVARDVTAERRLRDELKALAGTDSLTGLVNRASVMSHLAENIASCAANRTMIAALFVDLDNFKPVNDLHGHAIGDDLLVQVAQRIRDAVRHVDMVGRVGGDEFVITLSGVRSPAEALRVGNKICESLAREVIINDIAINISASVGVALYPDHAATAERLLREADKAMYQAKKGGGNSALLAN